ncbi:branched-chain amino acid transport system II carrier protein [Bacillus andreraoultii]|uniref:branched-chain amino acid transport system II carrier protein n=1 Tax=Bacillus andreraoultii TaxID=1499685 RepID=UPI000539810C|nr:branched-chain amino acid transport system II carrier protein [Bacillus andreraoultii]
MEKSKVLFSEYLVIGVMLFALFFGAGNLIFPAQLGQLAGENLWSATIGFLITGVGLPLLGVIAIGFSGSSNLQELSSRVHPVYGVLFTSLLYLTIGPFFAIPRTATVPFEVSISPLLKDMNPRLSLIIFSLIFFAITLWLSLNPSKIVNRIGKLLSPALILLLIVLIVMSIVNPIGGTGKAQGEYLASPFAKGFLEGYNTMDALASLVFAIIVINAIKSLGVKSEQGILKATFKSGLIAAFFLGIIYIGIAYMGSITVQKYGLFKNGGPVLSQIASHYLGSFGLIVLAVIMILACLTTSIGLITSCAEYFHTLMPKFSYKALAVLFSVVSFIIANFGLANIIAYSIPVLMFLYPLTIVLILLTFLSPIFHHSQIVYVGTIAVTFLISIVDGFVALCKSLEIEMFDWLKVIVSFYKSVLPFYEQGLGWFIPAIIAIIITTLISKFFITQEKTVMQ